MSDYSENLDEDYIEEIEPDELDEEVASEYSLTSYGIDFDVNGIVRRFEKELITVPFFQRGYVWPFTKACRFIESILIGLPIPGIFLYKEEDSNKLMVIDGQQRIKSLYGFVNGRYNETSFSLRNVHKDYEGLTYKKLSPELKSKFDDTIIHATIVKPDDPKKKNYESVFMIFERLNTGGLNLSPHEIRACISHGPMQDMLNFLAKNVSFKEIIAMKTKRRKDEEIVLRLIALSYNSEVYSGNMKKYLNDYMNENKQLKALNEERVKKQFEQTIRVIREALNPEFFKPSSGPINLAMLDSIFVAIYRIIENGKIISINNLKKASEELMKNDEFLKAISTGKTHHAASVKDRIREATTLFNRYAE